PIWFTLGAQWLLPLTLLWPLVRGVPWEQYRTEIGWRGPRGVWGEIGAGGLADLAGVPIYVGGAMGVGGVLPSHALVLGPQRPPGAADEGDRPAHQGRAGGAHHPGAFGGGVGAAGGGVDLSRGAVPALPLAADRAAGGAADGDVLRADARVYAGAAAA